jgi:hypothetical protein
VVGPRSLLVGGQDHDPPSAEASIGSGPDLDDATDAFSAERRRQRRVHAVEPADQMQIRRVHRRRLQRDEQLVATGVELGLGDERHDLCGITEAVQAKRVHRVGRCVVVELLAQIALRPPSTGTVAPVM